MAENPYEVLGVDAGASRSDIQAAYRRLARLHHPDVNDDPAAAERFKKLNEAYAVLSDPGRRARYDRRAAPFASAARRIRVSTGPPGAGSTGSRRGADIEMAIEVTVEESYMGGRRRLTVSTPDGARAQDITFPPGATDDTRIRLAGLGAYARGGPDGDLYLVVRLAAHPRYRVDDRDVTIDLPVTPWEAALGATVPVDMPVGPVHVVLPPGSSTGRRLRVRGQGLPNPDGPAGDLYAAVTVAVPPRLTPDERSLFQRLAETSTFDPRRP
jgi:curved DNA-binding protein